MKKAPFLVGILIATFLGGLMQVTSPLQYLPGAIIESLDEDSPASISITGSSSLATTWSTRSATSNGNNMQVVVYEYERGGATTGIGASAIGTDLEDNNTFQVSSNVANHPSVAANASTAFIAYEESGSLRLRAMTNLTGVPELGTELSLPTTGIAEETAIYISSSYVYIFYFDGTNINLYKDSIANVLADGTSGSTFTNLTSIGAKSNNYLQIAYDSGGPGIHVAYLSSTSDNLVLANIDISNESINPSLANPPEAMSISTNNSPEDIQLHADNSSVYISWIDNGNIRTQKRSRNDYSETATEYSFASSSVNLSSALDNTNGRLYLIITNDTASQIDGVSIDATNLTLINTSSRLEDLTEEDGSLGPHQTLFNTDEGEALYIFYEQGSSLKVAKVNVANTFSVTSLFNPANDINATLSNDVTVTMNENVEGSPGADDFRVFLSYRGLASCTDEIEVQGANIGCDPTKNFLPGETISLTIPNTLQNATSDATADAYTYSFQAAAGAGSGTFDSGNTITNENLANGSGGVRDSVLADIDLDDDLDLIVTNRDNDDISIFRNDGAGSFSYLEDVGTGNDPEEIVAGDFNADGYPDLAIYNHNNGLGASITVLLNDQSGGFPSGSTLSGTNSGSQSIQVADQDRDGDLDIMIAHPTSQVNVYVNDGTGAFSSATTPYTGDNALDPSGANEAHFADLDSDGELDLVYVGSGGLFNTLSGPVDNGFTQAKIITGDIDGDADIDVLAINASSTSISIFLNDGVGNLGPEETKDIGSTNVTPHLVDIDGDDDLDLIASASGIDFKILLNNGNGTFADAVSYGTGADSNRLAFGDINGDGQLDIITTDVSGGLKYYLQTASSSTFTLTNFSPGMKTTNVALTTNPTLTFDNTPTESSIENNVSIISEFQGDLDFSVSVDSGTNIATLTMTNDFLPGDTIYIDITEGIETAGSAATLNSDYEGQIPFNTAVTSSTPGTFSAKVDYNLGGAGGETALVDIDGDNDLDIITILTDISTTNNISIQLNNGSGVFSAGTPLSIPGIPSTLTTGDFDGENGVDIAATSANDMYVYLNQGSGVFGSTPDSQTIDIAANLGAQFSNIVAIALEYNHVEPKNIYVSNEHIEAIGSGFSILTNNGSGVFTGTGGAMTGNYGTDLIISDIDNDRTRDVITTHGTNDNANSNVISYLYNNGNGFGSANTLAITGTTAASAITGFFHPTDNVTDYAIANSVANTISFASESSGVIGDNEITINVGTTPIDITSGDFNGDGQSDIVTANSGSNNITVIINSESPQTTNYSTGSAPWSVAVGDVSGDGIIDIIVSNSDDNTFSVLMGNPVNATPTADAGEDQAVASSTVVTLDGSDSGDTDNDDLTFAWEQDSGTSVTLSDDTAESPTFTAPNRSGVLTFSLIVNDGTVNSARDTVTITINNATPLADAGGDQTVTLGEEVDLDGVDSSDEDAGDSLTYSWTFSSVPEDSELENSDITDATGNDASFTPDVVGEYIIQLIVNDGTENSVANTATITVEAANTSNSSSITRTRSARNGKEKEREKLVVNLKGAAEKTEKTKAETIKTDKVTEKSKDTDNNKGEASRTRKNDQGKETNKETEKEVTVGTVTKNKKEVHSEDEMETKTLKRIGVKWYTSALEWIGLGRETVKTAEEIPLSELIAKVTLRDLLYMLNEPTEEYSDKGLEKELNRVGALIKILDFYAIDVSEETKEGDEVFPDMDGLLEKEKRYVRWAQRNGVLMGYPPETEGGKRTFKPKKTIIRAELGTLIERVESLFTR